MDRARPIFLFTDFGWSGPYVGQMIGVLQSISPRCPVVSLMHDAPAMRPDLAAYLLPACCASLPGGSVVVAVVDPGVGGERAALIVETPDMTFVGPDNGLLSRLPRIKRVRRIDWRPPALSSSFHGRDLFAPVAAHLAGGEAVAATPVALDATVGFDWPGDASRVVFVDAYGNLMTGLRAEKISKNRRVCVAGRTIQYAETFCHAPPGGLFWYGNSQGLLEIAANGASAVTVLSLAPGDEILID
jgi:S-adenosylmethionine hydrolase